MRFKLYNPSIFWGIVIVVIISFVAGYNTLKKDLRIQNNLNTFEQHSFNPNDKNLGTYEFPNINVELEPEPNTFISTLFSSNNNLLIVLLVIYSIGLSMLFTYREKSRITHEQLKEKIQIEKVKLESKINIYDNIEQELVKYAYIISPEFNIDNLDKKLDKDVNYILFSSRVILEKILLHICEKYNIHDATLGEMIYQLYNKRVLNPQTNGYAHTIKAFGNNVAHPNLKHPMHFNTKDAMLVLSTLVTLLNTFDSNHLLEGMQNAA